MKKVDKARESIFKTSDDVSGPDVKGHDFSKPQDLKTFLDAYTTTGFQATHLGIAIDIVKRMRADKVTIFLGYTSNVVSSGLREIIAYLTQRKLVHVLVTTAGGVEEDIIKTLKPFVLSSFEQDNKALRTKGVNRIGNILVPNDRYIAFEKLMTPFLTQLYEEQKTTGNIISTTEFCRRLGLLVKDERSILYWAAKNDVPVICPALTDGSIGDMIFFFKHEHPEFKLDIADDIVTMNDLAINAPETGAIILGGSLPKHHIMNANMMREGTKYTVYVTTAHPGDGSNAGARPEEAVSWGKQSFEARSITVEGDATIIFPLLVAGAFVD